MSAQTAYKFNQDYSPEMEMGVLGAIILESDAYARVYGLVSEDCFYDADHVLIFNTIVEMKEAGEALDLLTITHYVYKKGVMMMKGYSSAYYLSHVAMSVLSSAHIESHSLILRQLAAKRLMVQLTQSGIDHAADVFESATEIQAKLKKVMEITAVDDWRNAMEVAKQYLQHRQEVEDNRGAVGISTSFKSLDALNGGFRPGNFVILAARPGIGKSAIMGGIAVNTARNGLPVGIITLEMTNVELFGRMLSYESGVSHSIIDREVFGDQGQQQNIYETLQRLTKYPIHFSEKAQVDINDIRFKAEKLIKRHGIKLLMIDYLQLIEETSGKKNRNRENAVADISRGLKVLAKEMQVPVIALAQLNRESDKSATGKPRMSHLRESGSLEQDADVIMLLHRDYKTGKLVDENHNSTERQADLIIDKWRNGATTELKLEFNPETMRFSEPGEYNFGPAPFDNPRAGITNVYQ